MCRPVGFVRSERADTSVSPYSGNLRNLATCAISRPYKFADKSI